MTAHSIGARTRDVILGKLNYSSYRRYVHVHVATTDVYTALIITLRSYKQPRCDVILETRFDCTFYRGAQT